MKSAVVCCLLFLASIALVGCPKPTPGPSPIPPDVLLDAMTVFDAASGTYTVKDACTHLRNLKCKQGNPTPRGATCEDVLQNVQGSGLASWDLTCIATVKKCADVDSCPTTH